MAGYRALAAVGRSIVTMLDAHFTALIPVGPRPRAVLAGTADFDLVNSNANAVIRYPAVAVYCYRLSVDPETRPGWSSVAHGDGIPRVPLRMHLFVSAWDQYVESELEWLGLAAQALETHSLLTGPMLDSTGGWRPGDLVQIVPDDLALESMSEAFQALTTDYRCCLSYVARVIIIEGLSEGVGPPVTTVGSAVRPGVPV
jgi:Pvc16 N-terminal domain